MIAPAARVRAANDATSGRYPGTCRDKRLTGSDTAIRLRVAEPSPIRVVDGLQAERVIRLDATTGDYIVLRREGLPAYHLAVVLDDAAQGVTTIVRGVDLLDSTAAHVHLQRRARRADPGLLAPADRRQRAGAEALEADRGRAGIRR